MNSPRQVVAFSFRDDAHQPVLPLSSLHQLLRQHMSAPIIRHYYFSNENKHPSLEVSNHGKTVRHTGYDGHSTVLLDQPFSRGVHTLQIKIDGPQWWVGIGVCRRPRERDFGWSNDN